MAGMPLDSLRKLLKRAGLVEVEQKVEKEYPYAYYLSQNDSLPAVVLCDCKKDGKNALVLIPKEVVKRQRMARLVNVATAVAPRKGDGDGLMYWGIETSPATVRFLIDLLKKRSFRTWLEDYLAGGYQQPAPKPKPLSDFLDDLLRETSW